MIEVHTCADSIKPDSLIWGDNSEALKRLLEAGYANRFQLIYLDPPFLIGKDLSQKVDGREVKVFSDKWKDGGKSYYRMLRELSELCHQLLAESGSLFLHCDYRTTAHSRLLLEEIFGAKNYVNEIIWFYKTGGASQKLGFGKKHDTIHFLAKNKKHCKWFPQKEKSYLSHKYGFSNIEISEDSQGFYTNVNCRDVFEIPALRGNQPERVPYPTQKPIELIKRLLLACSEKGDLVLDPFCGSGTTAVCASMLERKWISIDKNYYSLAVTKSRLTGSNYQELELISPNELKSSKFKVSGNVVEILDNNNLHSWSIVSRQGNFFKEELFMEREQTSCTVKEDSVITLNQTDGQRYRAWLKH